MKHKDTPLVSSIANVLPTLHYLLTKAQAIVKSLAARRRTIDRHQGIEHLRRPPEGCKPSLFHRMATPYDA